MFPIWNVNLFLGSWNSVIPWKPIRLIFSSDFKIKVLINRDNGDIGIFRKLTIVEKLCFYDAQGYK